MKSKLLVIPTSTLIAGLLVWVLLEALGLTGLRTPLQWVSFAGPLLLAIFLTGVLASSLSLLALRWMAPGNGDDATAELATRLAKLEERVAELDRKLGDRAEVS